VTNVSIPQPSNSGTYRREGGRRRRRRRREKEEEGEGREKAGRL